MGTRARKAASAALRRLRRAEELQLDYDDIDSLAQQALAGFGPRDEAPSEVDGWRWWARLLGTAAVILASWSAWLYYTKGQLADLQEKQLHDVDVAVAKADRLQIRATLAEKDARAKSSEVCVLQAALAESKQALAATKVALDRAESELAALAAAESHSALQPAFDDAMAQADARNTTILAAKLFDTLAIYARDLSSSDKKAAARARTINAGNAAFQRRVRDAHAHYHVLEALGYQHVGGDTGGSWTMMEPVFEARRGANFFSYCAARLGERCASICGKLAAELGLQFCDGLRRGLNPRDIVVWADFDSATAGAITMQVLKKGPPAGNINASLQKMMRHAQSSHASISKLQYKVGSETYTLDLSRLTQRNGQTGFLRSVSFFGQGGRAVEPYQIVCGTTLLPPLRGPTRNDAVAEQTARLHASDVLQPPLFTPAGLEMDAQARAALISSLGSRDERFETVTVVAVHEANLAPERRSAFCSAAAQLKARRGTSTQHAFHGSSLGALASIARDGFVSTNTVRNAAQFGKGIYLSPVGSGGRAGMMAASPQYASRDADRVQHVLFCEVVTGEPEQASHSNQNAPAQTVVSSLQGTAGHRNQDVAP